MSVIISDLCSDIYVKWSLSNVYVMYVMSLTGCILWLSIFFWNERFHQKTSKKFSISKNASCFICYMFLNCRTTFIITFSCLIITDFLSTYQNFSHRRTWSSQSEWMTLHPITPRDWWWWPPTQPTIHTASIPDQPKWIPWTQKILGKQRRNTIYHNISAQRELTSRRFELSWASANFN